MRLEHYNYIKLVKAAYKKIQAHNERPLLAQSTPARIRKECLAVYKERYDKKDEQALRAFFGAPDPVKQFLPLIERHETDKFKPLDNYLKENTDSTDHTNLELLAWLIDFPHRPYVYDNDIVLTQEELAVINAAGEVGAMPRTAVMQEVQLEQGAVGKGEEKEVLKELKSDASPTPALIPGSPTGTRKYKWAGLAILMFVIGSGGAYMMGDRTGQCMYWAGNHYEEVACDEKAKGRTFFPMDEERMSSLQKITREDTITERSIGVLYYLSTGGKKEYFTEGGNHPVYVTRKLKVLSRHIFDTYLQRKEVVGKDSSALQTRK